MNFRNVILYSGKNILRNKEKSISMILIISLIVFSLTTVILIKGSIVKNIEEKYKREEKSIISIQALTNYQVNSKKLLEKNDEKFLKKIFRDIDEVVCINVNNGSIKGKTSSYAVNIYGVDCDYFQNNNIKLISGKLFDADSKGINKIIISDKMAKKLFNTENCIGQKVNLSTVNDTNHIFFIEAVIEDDSNQELSSNDAFPDSVFIDINTSEKIRNSSKVDIMDIILKKNVDNEGKLSKNIVKYLEIKHDANDGYVYTTSDEIVDQYNFFIDKITRVLLYSIIITIIVGFIACSIIILKNVSERKKEIGLLKSFGVEDGKILQMIELEGIIISMISGAIGTLSSMIISFVICTMMNSELLIELKSILFVFFAVLILVMCISAIPLLVIRKKDINDCMI